MERSKFKKRTSNRIFLKFFIILFVPVSFSTTSVRSAEILQFLPAIIAPKNLPEPPYKHEILGSWFDEHWSIIITYSKDGRYFNNKNDSYYKGSWIPLSKDTISWQNNVKNSGKIWLLSDYKYLQENTQGPIYFRHSEMNRADHDIIGCWVDQWGDTRTLYTADGKYHGDEFGDKYYGRWRIISKNKIHIKNDLAGNNYVKKLLDENTAVNEGSSEPIYYKTNLSVCY